MLNLPVPELLQRLRTRGQAEAVIRRYFADQDFVEVHTPTRVPAPGTDVYIEPVPSGGEWLVTSPEFHLKRLLGKGVPRLFEMARCFRQEELGPWHQPEFTLVEWYRASASSEAVMADTEALLVGVAGTLSGGWLRSDHGRTRVVAPFERLSVKDAFREFAGIEDVAAFALEREDDYFQTWVDRIVPGLERLERCVFVTDFPSSQAALARRHVAEPEYAERFELFALGIELCNGYGELVDATEQRERFLADNRARRLRGKPELPIDEAFLAALDAGLPDCAGNALGLERLLALCLGTTLDGVVPFARR